MSPIKKLALFGGLVALVWIAYVLGTAVNYAHQHPEVCNGGTDTLIGQIACALK